MLNLGDGMTRTLCLLLLFFVPTALAQDERTRRAFVDLADRKYKMQQADQTFPGRRMSASENPLPLPSAGLPNDFDIHMNGKVNCTASTNLMSAPIAMPC